MFCLYENTENPPPILIKYIYFCPQKFNVYIQVKANDAIRPPGFAPLLPYDEFSKPKSSTP